MRKNHGHRIIHGVQIFLVTHSYNFAKYLEIRRENKEQVIFHNLYKAPSKISEELDNLCPENNKKDNEIYSHSAYKLKDLKENHIIIADSKLLDERKK